VIAFCEASAAQNAPGGAVTEHFFGRRKRRGSSRGEPERLESPEDIELAEQRESLFDRRSRRKAREEDAKLSLVERKVGLVVRAAMPLIALFVAGSYSITATAAAAAGALGGAGGWGVWAAWRRHTGRRDDGPI
jgi:hypothetical protein